MTGEVRSALYGAVDDSVPWLNSFRTAHPEITISPPDSSTVDWTAHRAGMPIARDFYLGRLRDKLDFYLAQECGR